jgi:hypothetical protein
MLTGTITAENEIEPYADNAESAYEKAAVKQLRRMYPTVTDIPTDDLAQFILTRTMGYMLHADQHFNTSATFSQEHYEKMEHEAVIYRNWINSDSDVVPLDLIYKPVNIDNDTDSLDDERPARKPRTISVNSRYRKGLVIFREDIANGKDRSHTIKRLNDELDLNGNTATVYYSKYKNET